MESFPSLADHLLVLLFGWALPFMSGAQSHSALKGISFTESMRKRFYLTNSIFLAFCAGIVLVSWYWQDRPMSAMGFIDYGLSDATGLVWLLTSAIFLLYFADLFWGLRKARNTPTTWRNYLEKTPFLPRHPRELPAYGIMCASAGIFEEIIYRGFMVTYFIPENNGRSGLPILALVVPAILFSLAHYYQGWEAMGKIFLVSMLLAVVFIASGSLVWVMAVHCLIDLAGGLAGMWMARGSVDHD